MKKLTRIFNFILIFCFVFSAFYMYENIKHPSYQYLKSITVYVTVCTPDKTPKWLGTGVVVKITDDYTYILTNRHVAPMEENGNVFVMDLTGTKKEAEVLKNSDYGDGDMSLIRVKGTLSFKRAVKGFSTEIVSHRAFMAGNNGGKLYIYREGVVSGYSGQYAIFQIPVRGGDSGTGIVDKNGKLIGLVFALEMDYGFTAEKQLVFVPNHTLVVCMTGKQIMAFLKGEI